MRLRDVTNDGNCLLRNNKEVSGLT